MARLLKECSYCHTDKPLNSFIGVKSPFFTDKTLPICENCIERMLMENTNDFDFFDKLCQWADIPFLAEEWTKLYQFNKEKTFGIYAKMYKQGQYQNADWRDVTKKYKEYAAKGQLHNLVPELQEETLQKMRQDWGEQYTAAELTQLENLFQGILNTQNISNKLQSNDVRRICKLSLIIDDKIRAGMDFKDDLSNYEKLTKIANLSPKNAKDANDFNSVGELFAYLEKKGWQNKFYDGATNDIVDNTMKNIQLYVRTLYTNETGISDDIQKRIEGLKIAQELQDQYDTPSDDLDNYEVEGYNLDDQVFEEEI